MKLSAPDPKLVPDWRLRHRGASGLACRNFGVHGLWLVCADDAPGTTEMRPGLVASHDISDDGTVFTFTFRDGAPCLDGATFEVGQEPFVALLRLQKGEVDLPGDGIPPARFKEVMGDPAQAEPVVEGGQLRSGYITLNVGIAPLDKLEVREAIKLAIDQERMTQSINGRAGPAPQPLPPTMPGYTDRFAGFAFDIEAAKTTLAEAGPAEGGTTELFLMNADPDPRIAQAIQQGLKVIGARVEIRSLTQANVIEAGGAGEAPMIWSGSMAWIADIPDPSNFYSLILSCADTGEGG